jgi:dolichol-phosphate mannosyltransferase
MTKERSISIVVPALDEERGLARSVASILSVVGGRFADYEIVIVDDGSTDATGAIADELAERHTGVRVVHHDQPHGMGGAIYDGWLHATKRWVMWVDSQGATRPEALDAILARVGDADVVVPYASNQDERPLSRRLIARAFRGAMNLLFGLSLRQYTHLVVCDLERARALNVRTRSHAFQAEVVIKLIKSGCSWVEVGVEDNFDLEERKSKAFRPPNVAGVATFVFGTLWDVYVTGRHATARSAAKHRVRVDHEPSHARHADTRGL